ncbi:MAG: hypothetical protein NVS9B7_02030 [Flavisolibacter sp.]
MGKKSVLVTATLGLMVVICLSFTQDRGRYKNLKILPKNITEAQMDSIMHHFSVSLGVRCTFCHLHDEIADTWDMASDQKKEKLRAREMMVLTQKINDKYFSVVKTKGLNAQLLVSCYTCHHGTHEPATKPPLPIDRREMKNDSMKINVVDSIRNK